MKSMEAMEPLPGLRSTLRWRIWTTPQWPVRRGAATLEFEAGLDRQEAEQAAAKEMDWPEMPEALRRTVGHDR